MSRAQDEGKRPGSFNWALALIGICLVVLGTYHCCTQEVTVSSRAGKPYHWEGRAALQQFAFPEILFGVLLFLHSFPKLRFVTRPGIIVAGFGYGCWPWLSKHLGFGGN